MVSRETNVPLEIVLAPMEGLTDYPMRDVLTQLGNYDWCVTEFLRITSRLLPKHCFYEHMPELWHHSKTHAGTPVHLQLLGSDHIAMADNAARAAELGACCIDINFGCPAKTVNRHGGGAMLLADAKDLFRIATAVRATVPKSIPVSAKIRLGIRDNQPLMDNIDALVAAEVSWVTIHARTKEQGYRPGVDWRSIGNVRRRHPNLKLIANGDINSGEALERCTEQALTRSFMIGRAAVSQPDLSKQIKDSTTPLRWQDVAHAQQRFLLSMKGSEAGIVGRYKQWLAMTALHYPEAKAHFEQAKRLKTKAELIGLMGSLTARLL